MSDYLAKPVVLDELRGNVARGVADSAIVADPAPGEAGAGPDPVDIEQALAQMGGDRGLFDEVARAFIDTLPGLVAELRGACSAPDAARLRNAAHSLKGAASNICAEPVRASAAVLEDMARRGDLNAAPAILKNLEERLDQLERFLADGD